MAMPIQFVKETYAELKKVVWPDRKTSILNAALVIVLTILAALFLAAIDFGFAKGVEWLVRLKGK